MIIWVGKKEYLRKFKEEKTKRIPKIDFKKESFDFILIWVGRIKEYTVKKLKGNFWISWPFLPIIAKTWWIQYLKCTEYPGTRGQLLTNPKSLATPSHTGIQSAMFTVLNVLKKKAWLHKSKKKWEKRVNFNFVLFFWEKIYKMVENL